MYILVRTNMGTTGVLRATKTIFPNEKVFDNYGYFYHVEGRDQRRKMLAVQYFFECNCMACKEDWPAYRVSDRLTYSLAISSLHKVTQL